MHAAQLVKSQQVRHAISACWIPARVRDAEALLHRRKPNEKCIASSMGNIEFPWHDVCCMAVKAQPGSSRMLAIIPLIK